jgi:hypothetical protein
MTDPILVRHPAYVTHVPRGARMPRETLVRHETPVLLKTRSLDEFGPRLDVPVSGFFPSGRTFRSDGSGFWEILRGRDGQPVPAAALTGYLSSGAVPDKLALAIGFHFTGTPVAIARGEQSWFEDDERGTPIAERDIGDVRLDGRQAAAAELRRFVEEDVALIGSGEPQGVALRRRPVIMSGASKGLHAQWGVWAGHRVHSWDILASATGSFDDVRYLRSMPGGLNEAAIERFRDAAGAHPDPDAGLSFTLNLHARPLLAYLDDRLARANMGREAHANVRRLRDQLSTIARRAAFGLAGRVDPVGEFHVFARCLKAAAACPTTQRQAGRLDELEDYVDSHLRPVAEAMLDRAVSDEDLPAIVALAP